MYTLLFESFPFFTHLCIVPRMQPVNIIRLSFRREFIGKTHYLYEGNRKYYFDTEMKNIHEAIASIPHFSISNYSVTKGSTISRTDKIINNYIITIKNPNHFL